MGAWRARCFLSWAFAARFLGPLVGGSTSGSGGDNTIDGRPIQRMIIYDLATVGGDSTIDGRPIQRAIIVGINGNPV